MSLLTRKKQDIDSERVCGQLEYLKIYLLFMIRQTQDSIVGDRGSGEVNLT